MVQIEMVQIVYLSPSLIIFVALMALVLMPEEVFQKKIKKNVKSIKKK